MRVKHVMYAVYAVYVIYVMYVTCVMYVMYAMHVMHVRMYVCMYVCMCVCVCMYVRMYVRTYVCMYVFTSWPLCLFFFLAGIYLPKVEYGLWCTGFRAGSLNPKPPNLKSLNYCSCQTLRRKSARSQGAQRQRP